MQQQLKEAITHFNLEESPAADNITAKFDANYNVQDSQQLADLSPIVGGNLGRGFMPAQSKELIQFSFKTSDCFEVREYDHLLKLISKHDDAEARKNSSRLKVNNPPPDKMSKRQPSVSPKRSSSKLLTSRT